MNKSITLRDLTPWRHKEFSGEAEMASPNRVALLALTFLTVPTISPAQLTTAFPPGSAVVTFASSNGITFDANRPVVKVWDITSPNGQPAPSVWSLNGFTPTDSAGNFIWSGSNLGQVFGVAIDNDPNGPYIYVTATAIYGSTTTPSSSFTTCPNCYPGDKSLSLATSADLPFSLPPPAGTFAGSPSSPNYGAVWRLSLHGGLSSGLGTYELIATIPNSNQMSLGQIAFNPTAQTFYVSNFADGLIYIFHKPAIGTTATIFNTYDHGVAGRAAVGLSVITDPTSPKNLFTQYGRRVWGLQYNSADNRFYYAVWDWDFRNNQSGGNNEIWSVALNTAGVPVTSGSGAVRLELKIPTYPGGLPPTNLPGSTPITAYSQPVSAIAFGQNGNVMLLAERGERIGRNISGGYDSTTISGSSGNSTLPHNSRILRYNRMGTGWINANSNDYGEYAGDTNNNASTVSWSANRTDSGGGVAFGLGYTKNGSNQNMIANPAMTDSWVWNTVNSYQTLGQGLLYGFQGARLPVPDAGPGQQLSPSADVYFIDYDNDLSNSSKNLVGAIRIFQGNENTGILKICKVAGTGIAVGTPFHFTAGSSPVTVPAGPPPGGTCMIVNPSFPVGTHVTVAETPIPSGDIVSSITVAPPAALLPPFATNPNLAAGTVDVAIGNGVTEVTFTDQRTGFLEICKRGDGVKGNFTFNVSPGGLGPFVVPAGACSPAIEVAAGTVTITEVPGSTMVPTGCFTIPAGQQGACTVGTSTVTVVPGDISTMTIAFITNKHAGEPPDAASDSPSGTRPPPSR
jgi:hypothetical protein